MGSGGGGGGRGGLNYFKFGTFDGRFPSDGAASMCSERVNILITAALNGERWKGPPGGWGGGRERKRRKKKKKKKKKTERKTGVWQNYDESYCWSTLCTLVCVLFVLVSV